MIKKFVTNDRQKDIDFDGLAKKLDGYSGSDIKLVPGVILNELLHKPAINDVLKMRKERGNSS